MPLNWATSSCIGLTPTPKSPDRLDLAESLVSLKSEVLHCVAEGQKLLGQSNLWYPPWLMSLQLEPLVCRCCDQGSIIYLTAKKRAEVVSHVKSLLRENTDTFEGIWHGVLLVWRLHTSAHVDTLEGVIGEVLPVQVCCHSLSSCSFKLQWSFQEVMTILYNSCALLSREVGGVSKGDLQSILDERG